MQPQAYCGRKESNGQREMTGKEDVAVDYRWALDEHRQKRDRVRDSATKSSAIRGRAA
jgi:hypothetical protein